MEDKGVVLLSGGLDSALLCAYLQRAERDTLFPLFINRNQRALAEEQAAAKRATEILGLAKPLEVTVGLDAYREIIPEAIRKKEGIPARNLVQVAVAAPYAYLNKASYIAIGINSSDDFPDCKREVFTKLSEALDSCLGSHIEVKAPFSEFPMTKADVITFGIKQGLHDLIWQTISCYEPHGGLHCGKCRGCGVRKEAFEVAKVKDETRYTDGQ